MLQKLQRQLSLIFIIFTSAIIAVTSMIALQNARKQIYASNENILMSNFHALASKLQGTTVIEDSWIADTERGTYIVAITDNGVPLHFAGSWKTKTDRNKIVNDSYELLTEKYQKTNDDATKIKQIVTSDFFMIKGDHEESYLGVMHIVPVNEGYRSLLLLNDLTALHDALFRQSITYICIAFLGILLMTAFGYYFVRRAMIAIKVNQQKQNEFIAAASHELRSPLAVISASLSAIRLTTDEQERDSFANAIERECTRTARLVDDLLLLANADAQNLNMRHEEIDVETILIDCMENFLGIAVQKHISITIDLPDDTIGLISGDAQRVMQLLTILVDNAIQYSPENSLIELKAKKLTNVVRIKVIDQGVGISDQEKKYVADRFYRIDASRSQKDHYGLGLSIANEIVRLHDGKITLADTDGGGLTVIIDLPIKPNKSL